MIWNQERFFWSKNLFFRSPGWKFCKNFLLCTSCQIIHFILFTIHLVWKKHVFTFSMRWLHDNFLFFSGLCHLSPISISSQHKLKIGKPKIQISMTCARTMVSSGAHCTILRCKRRICSQCTFFFKDLLILDELKAKMSCYVLYFMDCPKLLFFKILIHQKCLSIDFWMMINV